MARQGMARRGKAWLGGTRDRGGGKPLPPTGRYDLVLVRSSASCRNTG
jgi:hypothetical protein